ncbi:GNAT family N-acetyltransferase [Actinophytocola sp.]|uniref:GNAT family N-acetyltransferase n=1 Tax=Actinophytocola sp. TaxID=1872138 RepID=UPI002ED358A2
MNRAITTKRLVLSWIARDDIDELVAMLLNPALYDYIGGVPASAAEARARVERWLRGSTDPDVLWVNYVARCQDGGRLVGLAQATVLRAPGLGFGECELAYLVDPPEQKHGIASEMMSGLCAELEEALSPAVFTAHIYPGHAASEGVARAIGLAPTSERVDGELVWRTTAPRPR